MKIGIITPLDHHHKFIISEIYKKYKNLFIIKDNKKVKAKFKNQYINHVRQKKYEINRWFSKNIQFPEKKQIIEIYDVNKTKNIRIIKKQKFNLLITSGSIKLSENFINNFKKTNIINLHGGDPNYYRGLDSHFWAIYHSDFKRLCSCVHLVSKKLDTGKIINIKKIKLFKNMKLYQLRSRNIELVTKMLISSILKFSKKKIFLYKKNKIGKYYSFMPYDLKKNVEKKFDKYTKKLDE